MFSDDLTRIAFVERLPGTDNEKEKQRIVTAVFDKNNLTLSDISSIDIPPEVEGYLAFDSDNNICVVNGNLLQIYDENTATFRQEIIPAESYGSVNESKYAELQKAVTEYWGDDSLDDINSINWIFNEKR